MWLINCRKLAKSVELSGEPISHFFYWCPIPFLSFSLVFADVSLLSRDALKLSDALNCCLSCGRTRGWNYGQREIHGPKGPLIKRHLPLNDFPAFPTAPSAIPLLTISDIWDSNSRFFESWLEENILVVASPDTCPRYRLHAKLATVFKYVCVWSVCVCVCARRGFRLAQVQKEKKVL